MSGKERLSASVDSDLLDVGRAAVESGTADSLSAWVNDALRMKAEHERRLAAADDFFAWYEAEHGEITEDEMNEAERTLRARAIVVRGKSGARNTG